MPIANAWRPFVAEETELAALEDPDEDERIVPVLAPAQG